MLVKLARVLAVAIVASLGAAFAYAATPSFVVKCMRTAGSADSEKYGTYYFFLKDGFVKGFACDVPGRPCQIISQNAQTVVFQTPANRPIRSSSTYAPAQSREQAQTGCSGITAASKSPISNKSHTAFTRPCPALNSIRHRAQLILREGSRNDIPSASFVQRQKGNLGEWQPKSANSRSCWRF